MALLAEYGFSEGSGSTAADSSGNARNLAFSGSWAASAKNGSGLGSGGAAVGAMGPNTAQANFTIMAWVKLSLPGGGNFYGVATSNTQGRWLEVSASGAALLLDYFGGTAQVTASSTFPVNTATHVAVVVTGTTSATLYINGVAAGTNTVAATGANFSITDWAIGSGNGDIGPGASDWIDEVRVFDTALDAATITTWMNTPVGGGASPVALVAVPPPPFRTPWRGPRIGPFQLRGDRTTPPDGANISVADTATGTDALTVTATATLADTATGTDGISETVTATIADTATGTDALTVTAAVTLADTATGTDAIAVSATVTVTDTGTGTDAIAVSAAVPLADTGSGTDGISVTVTTTIADTATGADQLSVLTGTDQNQAWPGVAWMFLSPNSASVQMGGSRVASGDQVIGLPDIGSGTDAVTANAAVPLADTATATDALSVTVTVTVTDTADATDALSVAAAVALADTAAGVDTVTVTATVPFGDTATGVDGVTVQAAGEPDPYQAWPQTGGWRLRRPNSAASFQLKGSAENGDQAVTLPDTGSAADTVTVAAVVTITDTATAVDGLSVVVTAAIADTATGADTLAANATVTITDTATGADGISVSGSATPQLPDTASGTDAVTVTATVAVVDTAAAVDAVTVARAAFLTDTAIAVDGISVVVSVALGDTAAAVDVFIGPNSDRTIARGRLVLGNPATRQLGVAVIGNPARRTGRSTW